MKISPLKSALAAMLLLLTVAGNAQEDKSKRVSPPLEATATTDAGVKITINYSAPNVKGREIWGTLVEFDKVWRTGANEATTFEVDKDVTIEGHKLAKGKYALFTIVPKDGGEVTVILNKEANQWGAFKYKESQDALRFKVKSSKAGDVQEELKFEVEKSGKVDFAWEKLRFSFNVKKA
ncbi:MAG TPA: DUF2911 domain-containing protein [Bacteroidia bacterium]|nr:DUF2911 domain-containing protein [Bacteroidia bacterium]